MDSGWTGRPREQLLQARLMRRDIIVIGASTGGLDAVRIVLAELPRELPASLFIVLHMSSDSPGVLGWILERAGPFPAITVQARERIAPGRLYVPAPDRHLVLEPGIARATRGPKENRFRPAIDPLFRSAAQVYGPRVIGVILTGGLDDGTAGLWAVKQLGGTAVVQDPDDAPVSSMPLNAIRHVRIDHCVPLVGIGPLIARLAREDALEGEFPVPGEVEIEINIAKEDAPLEAGVTSLGEPSNYACPECHGVLLEMKEADRVRFRCHTGHAYSLESLMAEIDQAVEDSLWIAIRSIQEKELLMRKVAEHVRGTDEAHAAEIYLRRAQEAERCAALLRQAALDACGVCPSAAKREDDT
jgi:two-component system, chemotaxis family, protein-glutamate methylesterase/glutaminase